MSNESNSSSGPGAPAPEASGLVGSSAPTSPAPPAKRSNPLLIAALLLLIVGMGGVIWWEARPKSKEERVTRAFYTTDDGKTWFTDDAERLPPFDHGGKQAVRLYLFSCDHFKTRFVGYLESLPEEAFTTLKAEGQDPMQMDDDDIADRFGWIVKRPGDAHWVNSQTDPDAYQKILDVKCPDGAVALPVLPKNDE